MIPHNDLAARAETLARAAHAGQVDMAAATAPMSGT